MKNELNQAAIGKAHPFERAGMGVGPYLFCGISEMPNQSEDSAGNFGNMNPFVEIHALGLKAGAGTCCCCGMAITVICIVSDAAGDKWGVGSDCVLKAGEPSLGNAAKVALAKRRSAITAARNEARREADRIKWLATVSTDTRSLPGETNGQMIKRQNAERLTTEQAEKGARRARAEHFRDILEALVAMKTDFHTSLGRAITFGPLTERQAEFAARVWFPRATAKNESDRSALISRLTCNS